jgi:hypothetical protein
MLKAGKDGEIHLFSYVTTRLGTLKKIYGLLKRLIGFPTN